MNEKTLKDILLSAIEELKNEELDQNEFYSFPEYIRDAAWESDGYRSVDEYIAKHAIEYPKLHSLMRQFVEGITEYNTNKSTLWYEEEEQVGGAIARELALRYKEDVILYAQFVSSNDLNHEVYQLEDMAEIVAKWGACPETYFIAVARWLTPGQHRSDFDYDEISQAMKTEEDADDFLDAIVTWFNDEWFPPYNICNRYDDVVELLTMVIGKPLKLSQSEIEQLLDSYIEQDEDDDSSDTGRMVMVQDKVTLEVVTLNYATDSNKMFVSYKMQETKAFVFENEGELLAFADNMESQCTAQGCAWDVTVTPSTVDVIIEAYGMKLEKPVDILTLFTPKGQKTPAEEMGEQMIAGQKTILCKKLQLYKNTSAFAIIYCDEEGKRILDTSAYETQYLWEFETDEEMHSALQEMKERYLADGYELVLCEEADCAFDFTIDQLKQTAEMMKNRDAQMAEFEDDED